MQKYSDMKEMSFVSMSPENYRRLEKESQELIEQAEKFLIGRTPTGQIIPMTCVVDVINLCNNLSQKYQECVTASKNAKNGNVKEKYNYWAQKLAFCRKQIMNRYSIDD